MTRKKVILLILAALLVCSAVWYKAPRTLEKLWPGFQLDDAQTIFITYSRYSENETMPSSPIAIKNSFYLEPDSKDARFLWELLRDVTFRRSLTTILPQRGVRVSRGLRAGDMSWYITISTSLGFYHVQLFVDRLYVGYSLDGGSADYLCSTADQEGLGRRVLDFLRQYGREEAAERRLEFLFGHRNHGEGLPGPRFRL